MLLDANLPKHYCAEALSNAVYLKNCCPTKAVEGMTPFEVWYCKKKQVWTIFECLGVMPIVTLPRMTVANLTQKPESVFFLVTEMKRRDTGCMMTK